MIGQHRHNAQVGARVSLTAIPAKNSRGYSVGVWSGGEFLGIAPFAEGLDDRIAESGRTYQVVYLERHNWRLGSYSVPIIADPVWIEAKREDLTTRIRNAATVAAVNAISIREDELLLWSPSLQAACRAKRAELTHMEEQRQRVRQQEEIQRQAEQAREADRIRQSYLEATSLEEVGQILQAVDAELRPITRAALEAARRRLTPVGMTAEERRYFEAEARRRQVPDANGFVGGTPAHVREMLERLGMPASDIALFLNGVQPEVRNRPTPQPQVNKVNVEAPVRRVIR